MQKFIILTTQDVNQLVPKNPITDVEDIAVTDDDGVLLLFDSMDDADSYREKHQIDSQIVELPIY